jgi:hypothetical protein
MNVNVDTSYINPKKEMRNIFDKLKTGMYFTVQIGNTLKHRILFVVDDVKKGEYMLDVVEISKNTNKDRLRNDRLLEKDVYIFDETDKISIIRTGDIVEYYLEKEKWNQMVALWNEWNKIKIEIYQNMWVLLYYDNDGCIQSEIKKEKKVLRDMTVAGNIMVYLLLNSLED